MPQTANTLSRRSLLLGGASLIGGSMLAALCPPLSLAATDAADMSGRFMRMSNLLIDHRLNTDVGARIAETASKQYVRCSEMLDAIIAIAEKNNAKVVEDFFPDVPDGELKDFALWVISAWYSGCSSEKRDATVFTFEEALTFKTTGDIVTIPSYGLTGPNMWHRPSVPLADMPRF